ncbi:MAG TPA: PIN domain-containing protein [Desulfuromonadales bacterium]|nr:PIN domain-containing protein [Desulfuromonadales bacterium]
MIYLDTCIVIYLVERHSGYFPKLKSLLAGMDSPAISPLVEMEALIHPLRSKNSRLIEAYQTFFDYCTVLDMPKEVYRQAAVIRAEHPIKTPDALHLATANWHDCLSLWTNDERLARITPSIARNILSATSRSTEV